MKTKDIVLIGMFAAILSVISQISIPMPSGVPITIQLFGIALTGCVLGWKRGFFAVLVYILLGAAGLPVFSNLRGGIGVLLSPTGGYIAAWLVMVIFCGIQTKFSNKIRNLTAMIALTVTGVLIDECLGGLWWWYLISGTENAKSYGMIMAYSLTAFIPKDTILAVLAMFIGLRMRKPLGMSDFKN